MQINFFSPWNSLGVGRHTAGLMFAMHHRGHHLMLTPTMNSVDFEGNSAQEQLLVKQWLRNREQTESFKIPALFNFHSSFATQFFGVPRVGMSVFEIDKLNTEEVAALRTCDLVVTPSPWAKEILSAHAIESQVVPEGVDLNTYTLSSKKTMDKVVFGSLGKWETRKSSVEMIRAYLRATEGLKTGSEFRFHCFNPFMRPEDLLNQINKSISSECNATMMQCAWGWEWVQGQRKIIVYTHRFQEESDLVEFYHGLDFFLYGSKCEGFGLPLIEALACGIPAITTDVTGHASFLVGYPDELKLKKVTQKSAYDGVWFRDPNTVATWWEPNLQELTDKIQWALKNPTMYENRRQVIRDNVTAFSWNAAAEQLEKILS